MPTSWSSGELRFTLPAGIRVRDEAVADDATRKVDLPDGPIPVSAGSDDLVAALSEQGLALVEQPVDLEVVPGARRRRATTRLELTVGADEDAVVLLEQDGLYSWHHPVEREVTEPAVRRRAGGPAPSPGRRIAFALEFGARPSAAAQTRGFLGDLLFAGARAFVLKFVARKVAGMVMHHLEAHIEPGLLTMPSPDTETWHRIDGLGAVKLPKNRPARILLFVHGTFSSTVGAFGALGAFDWGRALLTAAAREYDAVLGYDHVTLSADPGANARDLLRALKSAELAQPLEIDVVCHSRGALVARSFTEEVLPQENFAAQVRRMIFVGGTNGGTELASPGNWRTLVDLYTNLVAAASRVLALVPHAAAPAQVIRGLVQGLGAFVKYLVSYATEEGEGEIGVPGLAAMRPGGPFVTTLNQTQPGQPSPADVQCYVVTSDFEPDVGGTEPKQLPVRLLTALADGLVDRLMGESNDLVVDTDSMAAIDLAVGGFVKDRCDLGGNAHVYHTVYFTRPEVCTALANWLGLSGPAAAVVPVGATVGPDLPVAAEPDIVIVDADAPAGVVRAEVAAMEPGFVVVRDEPSKEFYALTPDELNSRLGTLGPRTRTAPVLQRLRLAATDSSQLRGPSLWTHAAALAVGVPSSDRVVLLDAGEPVAVVPEPVPPPSVESLLEQPPAELPEPPRKPASPPGVTAHFLATMAGVVEVGTVATVRCTVSREALVAASGGMSVSQGSAAEPDRPIVVQAIAKAHAVVVGADRVEIDVPPLGEPAELYFDVKPVHEGQGEIWIIARQGPIALVTLRLTPTFAGAERRAEATGATSAEATVAAVAPETCVQQWLRITEIQRGAETLFQYELAAQDLGILETYTSAPLKVDRDTYVQNLYARIERRWVASAEDSELFARELAAIGGDLFDELFPAELRRLLWDRREELNNVLVVSTEPFIPWELVHLKNGVALPAERTWFLAEFGLVRWLHGSWPGHRLHCRKGKARYLTPPYPLPEFQLPAALAEGDYLRNALGAKEVEAKLRTVLNLLGQQGSFDVLHFAGHGAADGTNITEARIMLTGEIRSGQYYPEYLDASLVRSYAKLRAKKRPGPLVVFNACQVGQLGNQLTGLGGFAKSFLEAGAGAFISSLWSVGDAPAGMFTTTLYESLLKGQTLSQATRAARAAARQGGEDTWLAYVVYGNPCATFTIDKASPRKLRRAR